MEKFTYECLDCGHKFEGDLSTDQCPNCQSLMIRRVKGGIPPIVWKILGCVVVIIILFLLLRKCISYDPIIADFSVVNNEIKITVSGVSKEDLRAKYKIVMTNDNDAFDKVYPFNGKTNIITIYTAHTFDYQFVGGATYTFNFVEKHSGLAPKDFRWKGNHTYTHPLPPVTPEIKVSKNADCGNNTYMIVVSVVKGRADRFYLNEKEQADSIFYDVEPNHEVYKVKVYDAANNLWSEISELSCRPIHRFHITSKDIDMVLDSISKRKIMPGTALEKINNNNDIRLAQSIDGNSTLEAALDYAYNQHIRYKADVEIEHQDCNDRIVRITLSK